ncbi:uncharacterized protein [Nicotiana tomentosiformis]|uniref:uncharacterized protein n=1 Tax=Nicotiana tomentosiformis TaxID=4098 RepID=UPI00388CB84F
MVGNEERPVIEAARPNLALMTQAIVKPDITGHFKLKQYMVQLIQSKGQYVGLSHEDLQRHIQNFLEITDTYNYPNVSKDYVRLTLFPFSVMGEAKEWLQKEPANSIHNWDDIARKFLIKFFPTKKTKSLRSQILGFQQRNGETLQQAWERYKRLLRDFPHHCQTDEVLGHTFVDGLDEASKMNLDSACGGSCMARPYSEIQILLNNFIANDNNWQEDREPRRAFKQKAACVIELDDFSAMREDIARLANQMNKMTMHHAQKMQHVQQMSTCCELCGEGHTSNICPVNPESIYYVGQQARGPMNQNAQYGNTYNPNWRNHLNFSWGGNQNIMHQANYNHPPQPPHQAEEILTGMIKKLLIDNQKVMAENQQFRAETQQVRTENQQLRTEFRKLGRQFGQMANNQNTRPAGALLSDTEKNPQVNAVTLRNGRELVEVPKKKNEQSRLEEERVPKHVEVDERNKTEPEQKSERVPPPFPQRLRKKNDDHMFHKFLDMLKQIHLNIPLVDMLREVPKICKIY